MKAPRGMSLIDVVVGSFLVLIIFLALFGLLRTTVVLSSLAKIKSGATAVATSQMEYIRSLPYDSVGTVGGIPAGVVPQTITTTENDVTYTVRTFVQYVDDPADGYGAADTNGITTDYKRAKVAVTYAYRGLSHEMDLVSNFAPPGIETTNGGGTLQIHVVNATGVAVPGASVHIVNTSTSPAVDVTTFSDSSGAVMLPGAAVSTSYQVTVTKDGYSTAETYVRDATNQNPTPGYLTVVKDQTTTSTFAIDALSTLALSTFAPASDGLQKDTFADMSKLAATASTTVASGALVLTNTAGVYDAAGSARSIVATPTALAAWTSASSTLQTSASTTILMHVVDGSGNLIPDSALAGNAAGFASSPIDLSNLSTTTYPALALKANLSTTDSGFTPSVLDWAVGWKTSVVPLPNVSVTLTGAKTKGSTGAGAPIYKTIVATTTDANGVRSIPFEWDVYQLAVTGHDIEDACPAPPYVLAPGTLVNASLTLVPSTANSVLVSVSDNTGAVVPGVSVTLSRTGFSKTVTASSCGAAYFGTVSSASDYTVTITKSGYVTTAYSGVSVSGSTLYAASFP